jgi:hypothetical protein
MQVKENQILFEKRTRVFFGLTPFDLADQIRTRKENDIWLEKKILFFAG